MKLLVGAPLAQVCEALREEARSLGAAKAAVFAALLAAPLPGAAQDPEFLPSPEELFILPGAEQGCWVSFFEGTDFRPPAVQFTGRTCIESFEPNAQAVVEPPLQKVGGPAFLKDVDGVVVGPHARLIGFEGEWFGQPSLELAPESQVPRLGALAFHDRVQSFKVFCEE